MAEDLMDAFGASVQEWYAGNCSVSCEQKCHV